MSFVLGLVVGGLVAWHVPQPNWVAVWEWVVSLFKKTPPAPPAA